MRKKFIKNPRMTSMYIVSGLTGLLSMIFLACPCTKQVFEGFFITNSAYLCIDFAYNIFITLSSVLLILVIILSAMLFAIGIAGFFYSEEYNKKDKFYSLINGDTILIIMSAMLLFTIGSTVLIYFGIKGGNIALDMSPYLGIGLATCSLVAEIILWMIELKAHPRAKKDKKNVEQKAFNTTQDLNKKLQSRMGTKIR